MDDITVESTISQEITIFSVHLLTYPIWQRFQHKKLKVYVHKKIILKNSKRVADTTVLHLCELQFLFITILFFEFLKLRQKFMSHQHLNFKILPSSDLVVNLLKLRLRNLCHTGINFPLKLFKFFWTSVVSCVLVVTWKTNSLYWKNTIPLNARSTGLGLSWNPSIFLYVKVCSTCCCRRTHSGVIPFEVL